MAFLIRMGIPEMEELWNKLQSSFRNGTINKQDKILYQKWGKAIKKLSVDPKYPSLNTHDIEPLTKRYGIKVWQSYIENNTCGAMRMFWIYGPNQNEITIIGLEPHPEDRKNGAYDRVTLSNI